MNERRGRRAASGAWRRTVTAGAAVLLVGSALAAGGAATASPSVSASSTPAAALGSTDVQANGTSYRASISANGRYVAFTSAAGNLIPGDTLGVYQVFVRDLRTGSTTLVSSALGGAKGNGASFAVAISADGRYVVFNSYATDLVVGDTNDVFDVFVRDLVSQVTQRVSVSSSGEQSDAMSLGGVISADGHWLAFDSDATNLVAEDTNGKTDVFLRNLGTGVTRRLSVNSHGRQAGGYSYLGSITADGRFVVFESDAPDLVARDTNHRPDVFMRNVRTGVIRRVSVSSSGRESNLSSYGGSVSADGRYVAFSSFGSNLVAGDTNNCSDLFVRDLKKQVTRRLTVGPGGTQIHTSTYGGSISADGRFVTFASRAVNLVPGEVFDGTYHVFLSNWRNHVIRRVSISSSGVPGNDSSSGGTSSADGRYVAFASEATNLVAGDTNALSDIFVRDRAKHVTLRVSVG